MKKKSVFEILENIFGALPVICVIVCLFINMGSKLYLWLGIYILLFGWITISQYISSNMSEVEKPAESAGSIQFLSFITFTILLRLNVISENNGGDPILCFVLVVIVYCGIFALKYHSEKHAYYKMQYNELIKDCNELRKEIENGHNT